MADEASYADFYATADELRSYKEHFRAVALALGVIIDDPVTLARHVLASAPTLPLDTDDPCLVYVTARDIDEDCQDAIDELKGLVVLLHRWLVESGGSEYSEGARDATETARAYLDRMRNFPMRG